MGHVPLCCLKHPVCATGKHGDTGNIEQTSVAHLTTRLPADILIDMKHYLQVTLRDGSQHRFTVATVPAHWKSWIMRNLPYGTCFYGATFERGTL